jgi:hypothetical protein
MQCGPTYTLSDLGVWNALPPKRPHTSTKQKKKKMNSSKAVPNSGGAGSGRQYFIKLVLAARMHDGAHSRGQYEKAYCLPQQKRVQRTIVWILADMSFSPGGRVWYDLCSLYLAYVETHKSKLCTAVS